MKRLSELIPEGIRTCAIAGHVNPDGDCVGSVTAVYQYVRKYRPEIDVTLYLERPADELMFLKGMEEIVSEIPETERKDLFISCDASSVDRIGVAANLFHAAAERVCIDHHVSNPGFADVNVIDAEASSCAEVLCSLIDGQELTKEIADSLFTGIIHDSGVFQYSNTRPETLRAAARLMEKGAACSKIIDESFNMRSFRKQRMLGKALGESRLCLDGQVIMTCVTEEDMKAMRDAGAEFRKLALNPNCDLTALTEADVAFHDTIYRGTRNRRLNQILANLREQMYRFRLEYLKDASIRESLVSEHEEIMKAVAGRDGELAADLIGEHIDNQQKVIHASIASMEGES